MCGLFGIADSTALKLKQEQFIVQATFCGSLRGWDSTGLALVDKDSDISVYKKALAGPDYITSRLGQIAIKNLRHSFIVLGHNRAATVGKVTHNLAHPFEFGNIVGTHNGTVRTTYRLPVSKHPVDSMDIFDSLSLQAEKDDEEYTKVLSKISGSFALVWYDKEKEILYLTRNDDRDLAYADAGDYITWASEGGMLHWLMSRNSMLDKNVIIKAVTPLRLVRYDCRNMTFLEPIPYEEDDSYELGSYSGGGYGNVRNTGEYLTTDSITDDPIKHYNLKDAIAAKVWNKDDEEVLVQFTSMVMSSESKASKAVAQPPRYHVRGWAYTADGTGIPVTISYLLQAKAQTLIDWVHLGKVVSITASDRIPGLFHRVGIDAGSLEKIEDTHKKNKALKRDLDACVRVNPTEAVANYNRARKKRVEKEKAKEKESEQKDVAEVSNVLKLPFRPEGNDCGAGGSSCVTVLGPMGKHITLEEFAELTEFGCCNCKSMILWHDHQKIGWVDNKDPVCPDCVDFVAGTWPDVQISGRPVNE